MPTARLAETLPRAELGAAPRGLPPVPPDCPPELVEKMGADVLTKVERRWSRRHHRLGPCLVWTGPTLNGEGVYGWVYDPAIRRMDDVHRVVWRRVYRPIPRGPNGKPLEVDHQCDITLCERPDHLQLLTKGDNVKRRGPTRGKNKRQPEADIRPKVGNSAAEFAIALFASIDRPGVEQRPVTLDELRQLLGHFEVLEDKRRGRCWSPAKYADGAFSRGNAGVESIGCLVFDLDRVPPDPKRLEGVQARLWALASRKAGKGRLRWQHR